ncbi:MAG: hypothetical protein ACRDFB_10475 [Rhabdochlamydiaceae bacterium]
MDITDNEIRLATVNLRNQNQIANKQLLGLIGTTIDGKIVWTPDSYQRGFVYELTPMEERPKLEWELFGIFAKYSDGHINYLPTFNDGRNVARDMKTNLLAQYAIHTKKEFVNFKEIATQNINNLIRENADLQRRLSELEKDKKE